MGKAASKLFEIADRPKATEHAHQTALFAFLAPDERFRWLFAIPNGGSRDRITAGMLKAEGVKSGVFDLCYPVPRMGYHGLFIELKTPERAGEDHGGMSDTQVDFGKALLKNGYRAELCHGWRHALDVLLSYEESRL